MVKIIRSILSPSLSNVPNKTMTPKYITCHNTANPSKGADAEMHARYQHNGSGGRQASWGYTVDDKVIYQTLEDWEQGWHAGDDGGNGNTKSIGIEICENSDGDFEKAVKNAQWLIAKLMNKHNIPIKNVVTHKHWSGKNCPRLLLGRWDSFKHGIGNQPSTPKPSKSKQRGTATVTVPSLSLRNKPSTKGKLIRNLSKGESYKVWDEKNGWLRLGNDMWASWQKGTYMDWSEVSTTYKKPSKPKPKITGSVVDYMNKKNMDASYTNRVRLAGRYGIKDYKGTSAQNLELLGKLQGQAPPKAPVKSYRVGSKVKIDAKASRYATGQAIPYRYKNKAYTIEQVKSDRVLLKEVYSWVYKKDLR